jgi:hypothetical protein
MFEKRCLRGIFECKSEEITQRCGNGLRNEQASSDDVRNGV